MRHYTLRFTWLVITIILTALYSSIFAQRIRAQEIFWHPVAADLFAVARPSAGRIIAVGEYGTIMLSTDAGVTWQYLNASVGAYLFDIYAHSDDDWVVAGAGSTGQILRTTDGGGHWQSVVDSGGPSLHALDVVDARHGLGVGGLGTISRTTSLGTAWHG